MRWVICGDVGEGNVEMGDGNLRRDGRWYCLVFTFDRPFAVRRGRVLTSFRIGWVVCGEIGEGTVWVRRDGIRRLAS